MPTSDLEEATTPIASSGSSPRWQNGAPFRGQTFWLQLAALQDPDFYPGVPWAIGRQFFDILEKRGLVRREQVPSPRGRTDRALITQAGAVELEMARHHRRAAQARKS